MSAKRYCENCGRSGAVADFRNFGVIWALCPHCAFHIPITELLSNFDFKTGKSKNPSAVALGSEGGRVRSEKKSAAARTNGARGGRPPIIILAKNLSEGHTIEMRQSEVMAIIEEALPSHPDCWGMSAYDIKTLARENLAGLKDGTSSDISFGDYEFTMPTV